LDPVATFGPWGATAVAGQLLAFHGDDMENALSLSSGQAAASLQATQTGGEVTRLHPGFAAMYGLRAARLAQLGLSGAREILEGPMGFLMCVAGLKADETPNFDVARINEGFGDEWYIEGVTLKQHPVTSVQLSVIEAVGRLRGETRISSTEVAEVEVAFPRNGDGRMRSPIRVPRPGDVLGAQQSIAWGVAMALVLGRNDISAYQQHVPPHGRSGEIAALAERVRVVDLDAATGMHPDFPTITVRLRTGGSVEAECAWPRGNYLHNPMTAAELRGKFKLQAGLAGLSEAQQASVLETVAAFEEQDDVTRLMASVTRGG
jgi:2-methylcitrate dehydratase PrpD